MLLFFKFVIDHLEGATELLCLRSLPRVLVLFLLLLLWITFVLSALRNAQARVRRCIRCRLLDLVFIIRLLR